MSFNGARAAARHFSYLKKKTKKQLPSFHTSFIACADVATSSLLVLGVNLIASSVSVVGLCEAHLLELKKAEALSTVEVEVSKRIMEDIALKHLHLEQSRPQG